MATAPHDIPATRRRALVVDDSHIARYVLSGQLKRLGFEIETANTGEAALKQLDGPLPDVVFMDHLLPGIQGLEAVRQLREQPRNARLPIVMYTSQDTDTFTARARDHGADDVYLKTDDESTLMDILRRMDLLPEAIRRRLDGSNVTPIRAGEQTIRRAPAGKPTADPDQLADQLGPVLDAHHEKLRSDLLAEFAILEQYEERMRQDLFARVDNITRHAIDRLDRSLNERGLTMERGQRRRMRAFSAMAAGLALALAGTLAAAFGLQQQRIDQLEIQGMATSSDLESQVQTLEALQQTIPATATALPDQAAPVETEAVTLPEPDTALPDVPSAAGALVAELQSMGILGSVRIETSAGSFCVGSTLDGFRLQASGMALEDCEVLPVMLTTANW